ncbi:MAG: hypothetical protein WAN11_02450 [Syntrophobacteraceae bacterium]
MGVWELIWSDCRRFGGGASEAITNLGFYATSFYRISRYFSERGFILTARFLQLFSCVLTGADVSHKADIGPGLVLLHPTGVVIGEGAKIGKNAIICQGCTISRNMDLYGEAPVIGDSFFCSPSGVIIGPLVIGDFVLAGPKSVVLKNVTSNNKVLGNPARALPAAFKR